MKQFSLLILFFLICQEVIAQSGPNDCEGYIQVCGNYDIQMDVSGPGIQEIEANVCQSWEHNSLWLHFNIEESGTLGFNLIPASSSISEDYDFWIFGPNAVCGNIGQSIRCSTTNPQAAAQANNHTGLNDTSTDDFEGPGPDGDSFVRSLDVLAGEEYFLVIDRPIGNSAFTLEWTGTAILENPLEDYNVFDLAPIELCDTGNDGIEEFDFSELNSQWIDNLNGIDITYHFTESDAFSDLNPLPIIADVSEQTYFVRIENAGSKCFEIKELKFILEIPQIHSIDVINETKIIVNAFPDSADLMYSMDGGEWQNSAQFNDVEPGWHHLQVKLEDGCLSDIHSTYVLKITNFISPNGDGYNDSWAFPGLEEFEGSSIAIYDRYGKEIFKSDGNKPFIWDGTYNGRPLPTGDYWYFISLSDGRKRSGFITIIN